MAEKRARVRRAEDKQEGCAFGEILDTGFGALITRVGDLEANAIEYMAAVRELQAQMHNISGKSAHIETTLARVESASDRVEGKLDAIMGNLKALVISADAFSRKQ